MKTIEIKLVTMEDLDLLRAISIQTFRDTFAADNTQEDMDLFLQETYDADQLSSELEDAHVHFYFAEVEGETAGYLKLIFHEEKQEFNGSPSLEIARIYVGKDYLGKSVGQALLDHAISVAKENDREVVWLGVWEHNPRAIRFYEKNGFAAFGKHPFQLGNDLQTDILMKMNC